MKFENDYIRIIIEKKELTIEQKEACSLRWKKRRPMMIIASLLIVAIVGGVVYSHMQVPGDIQQAQAGPTNSDATGVAGNAAEDDEYGQVDGEYVATSKLASGLQEKYADKSLYNYTYGEAIEDVKRAEPITFKLGYDVADLGVDRWTDIFALYQDPGLTYQMGVKYSFDKETGIFTMEPSDTQVPCEISMSGLDVGTVAKYPHNQTNFYDNGAGTSWGNIGTAYLASYRDKETGELLDKPEVSIVTFEAEIKETPALTYTVTNDGRAQFRWNEVEGATEYFLCIIPKEEKWGYNNTMQVLAISEDTAWTTEYPVYGSYITNTDFCTFDISEDDWKDEESYEGNLEKYKEPGIPGKRESLSGQIGEGLCVIAVNEEGTSMISNIIEVSELAPKLPYAYAMNTKKENDFVTDMKSYDTVDVLPSYDYITMCDGYTATKLIDYDTENAYMEMKRFMIIDKETGELIGGETVNCLCIPYRVEGTCFMGDFTVAGVEGKGYDPAGFEKDMAFLEDREEKLGHKSGVMEFETSLQFGDAEETELKEIRKVDTTVFANSALSEYLATNMLGGVKVIDLSEFPEARDANLVDDALLEAYYQNPLILGIEGYRISRNGKKVKVVYEETPKGQARKQEEIQERVSEITEEVITDDMTELEKVVAINQYLCDTIVYDDEALADAEENNYMYVDEKFNDSFNAYGALVNGKCVCAGYAAAFRLLAQEAGLESIVVTGFLDGSVAHAWNKVKIDGEWNIVDVTNNDNEYFFNALLNLPASVGDTVLMEDEGYMMDMLIPVYTGESDENEYYHVTDNYFPAQEVGEILAKELAENGTATLRTDYELNDNEFYEITDVVYEIMGDDIELYGYYWLGVIYLTMEL